MSNNKESNPQPKKKKQYHTLHHDLKPRKYTKRWLRQLKRYPDHLRVKGSVLPSIVPLIILCAGYAYMIAVMYIQWGWTHVALSNSIVPVLSVVLGLLLAFRANTSYARYYEGRQLWQDLASNTRNLARLIWCSIPERTQNDHLEKMRCMKLLLAFAVSTKHYLRREYGIDYYDLDYLLPPNWIPAAADDPLLVVKDDSSDEDAVVVSNKPAGSTTHLLDASQGGDDIHDLGNQKVPVVQDPSTATSSATPSATPSILESNSNGELAVVQSPEPLVNLAIGDQLVTSPTTEIPAPALTTTDGDKNKKAKEHNFLSKKLDQAKQKTKKLKTNTIKFISPEDLPDEGTADMSLPLEIIFRMSLYMAQAKNSGKIDGTFSNVIITHLNNLNDCLSGMERIVNTPIPAVYVVHLKQSVALFILAIPFTLISELRWWIVPTIILISFTLLGIDAIGAQIENPFGYNSNDLPLNTFCDSIRKEIEFIVYHLPNETENAMMV